jgi:hypothetical protein
MLGDVALHSLLGRACTTQLAGCHLLEQLAANVVANNARDGVAIANRVVGAVAAANVARASCER